MNIIYISLLLFVSLIFLNRFLISKKFFLDNNLNKKQAVHSKVIPRSGGLVLIFTLFIVIIFNYFVYNFNYFNYLPILFGIFLIGLIDDYGIKFNPFLRFLFLIVVCLLYFNFFDISLRTTGIGVLDSLINNYNIDFIIITICFLILINGSNFIDGVNVNLSFHYISILAILFYLFFDTNNFGINILILSTILTFIVFSFYNMKNKIFFGDGGAYLAGTLLGLLIVEILGQNTFISPFFFLIVTTYIGSEVLISFIRRIFSKNNVTIADFNHLHSYLFKIYKNTTDLNTHICTSLTINLVYLILVIPAFFFKNDIELTRNYLIFVYLFYVLFFILIKKISTKFK